MKKTVGSLNRGKGTHNQCMPIYYQASNILALLMDKMKNKGIEIFSEGASPRSVP